MKYIKHIVVLLLTTVLFNGCTDEFDELNTRPDAVVATGIDANLLGATFAQAQYFSMNGLHWRFQISENLFSDLYAQYFATTAANFDSDRHVEVGRWIDLAWTSFYGQAAPQLKFVEDFAIENGLSGAEAIAKVWRVQSYHRMTDYWGPTLYSQVGNTEESTVSYDTQESIYRDFFTTLDEAVAILKTGEGAFGSNDQVFGGDAASWLRFANSLRLRLAMRIRYVDANLARSEAEKAIVDGVMTSNDHNASLITTANSKNPFNTITNWGEFRMSASMESILKGYDDPRISAYFSPAVDGDSDGDGNPYEGLRNGLLKVDKTAALNGAHSDMAAKWLPGGGNGPGIKVMSASEVYFLRAEGATLGWTMGGTAQEMYEMGIEMSLTENTAASSTDIAAYIASSNTPVAIGDSFGSPAVSSLPVAFNTSGTAEEQLEQIITQKWIALYPDGWEAWAELRRTGYPVLYDRLNSDNPDVPADAVMRRVTYVTSEFSNNLAAVEAAQKLPELVGGDKNSTRLWWDKK